MRPLKKGLRLPDFKYRSLSSPKIEHLKTPRTVTISLNQHIGTAISPCVSEGEQVYAGTKIAEGDEWNSVPLHSGTSGKVVKIGEDKITIESDGLDQIDQAIRVRAEIPEDSDQLIEIIREAGIVDLGGSALPVHSRLVEAREKNVETLVINGCESEPFLTADHLLMLNQPVEILKGAELLRIASGAKKVIIAVEKNKLEAVELLNSKNYQLKLQTIQTLALSSRYPQGSERALAETVLERKLGQTDPISASVLVEHIATAFAVYEAVYLRKPLYERVVTVTGPCVIEPKNIWVPLGASALDLISAAKGLMREPERIVFGGPMTGESVTKLDEPVTKRINGVIALPKDFQGGTKEEACIRCGECVEACPEDLQPEILLRAVRKNIQALTQEYDIDACTECAACSYVCPSKIPVLDVIRKGKTAYPKTSSTHPAYALSPQG